MDSKRFTKLQKKIILQLANPVHPWKCRSRLVEKVNPLLEQAEN